MRAAKFALLVGSLLAFPTGAMAQGMPALITTDVNLRMGPTTNSPSLGIIPGGSNVQAGPCGGGWCQAYVGGRSGFISQIYLDFGGPQAYAPGPAYGAPPPPPVIYGPPRVYRAPAPYWVGPRW